jgi:ABC-type phosphate/phosphonate transport system substrate-binding protein
LTLLAENGGPTTIASLPMYDFPELVAHTDTLWAEIARQLEARGVGRVPATLVRPSGSLHDHWLDPGLLLSHTCGYPVVRVLTDAQHVLGSFAVASGSPDRPGWYRSVVVCRADDARAPDGVAGFDGAPVAVNDAGSLSGWVSLGVALADAGIRPGPVTFTGAHAASVDAVRRGAADLASIDAHSLSLFSAHRPAATQGLRVIGHGPEVAMTPLITTFAALVPALREAVAAAVDAIAPATRAALQIDGFVVGGREMHAQVLELAATAKTVMPLSGEDPEPVAS